jgi:hypothetical protein
MMCGKNIILPNKVVNLFYLPLTLNLTHYDKND